MNSKAIRKDGNKTGLAIIANQIVFQAGTLVMLFVVAFMLGGRGIKLGEGTLNFLASDLMQLIAGSIFLVFYLVNRNDIKAIPISPVMIKVMPTPLRAGGMAE